MRRPTTPLTARFFPSFESLETRLTRAVSVTEINGNILLIDGTVDAEQVAITDDGYGNVTVSAGVGGTTLGTFDGITRIRVRMAARVRTSSTMCVAAWRGLRSCRRRSTSRCASRSTSAGATIRRTSISAPAGPRKGRHPREWPGS